MYVSLSPVATHRRALGDVTPTDLTSVVSGSGLSTSPFVYIGGALLLWFAISKLRGAAASAGIVKPRRRRTRRVPAFTTALYAAGAAAGGYLVGKYSGL